MKYVHLRIAVDDGMLEALAERMGQRKATLKDARTWLYATIYADIEELVNEYDRMEN